jgi:hypothetical protein
MAFARSSGCFPNLCNLHGNSPPLSDYFNSLTGFWFNYAKFIEVFPATFKLN